LEFLRFQITQVLLSKKKRCKFCCSLQHIPEGAALVLFAGSVSVALVLGLGPVLLVELLVLPGAVGPQRERKEDVKQHESGADRHALVVVRTFLGREQARSQDGTALADEVEDGDTGTAAGVGGLVVQDPGENKKLDEKYGPKPTFEGDAYAAGEENEGSSFRNVL